MPTSPSREVVDAARALLTECGPHTVPSLGAVERLQKAVDTHAPSEERRELGDVPRFSLDRSDENLVDCALQVYSRAIRDETRLLHDAAMAYRREILRRLAERREHAEPAKMAPRKCGGDYKAAQARQPPEPSEEPDDV